MRRVLLLACAPLVLLGACATTTTTPAAKKLALANQLDPRVLYLTAVALGKAGDSAAAAAMARRAAKFNGLAFNYGYVRVKAGTIGSSSTQ